MAPPSSLYSFRKWLPALAIASLTAASLAAADYAPPATGEMAVVFSPFANEAAAWRAVVAAGGLIVAPSRLSNVVVAYATDQEFSRRVRSRGALFTLAATGLCAPLTTQAHAPSR